MMQAATHAMAQRGLKPAAVLAAGKPHGDRLRYIAGCRCDLCRKANSNYENQRAKARAEGDWNGIVPARAARRHMLALSKKGIGRRAIAAATDIADSILAEIRSGKRKQIRARTERRILAVDTSVAADRALVPAGPTWSRIEALLAAGYTKSYLALALGRKTPALQIGRETVTVKNEAAVARLHQRLLQVKGEEVLVNPTKARKLIDKLRDELYSASRIVREIGEPATVEDGEVRLPAMISRAVEARIVAVHQRLME